MKPDQEYCTQLAKKYDSDRYFCSLFTSEKKRQQLHTLYAFSHELGKIKEITNEPMVGLIRLQWWHEAIDSIKDNTPYNHEVVQSLHSLNKQQPLPFDQLHDIITAREDDLEQTPFNTLNDLEKYATDTTSNLLIIGLNCLNIQTTNIHIATNHTGIAWVLLGHIRSLYHHLHHNFCFFPVELLQKHQTSAEQLIEGLTPTEKIEQLIQEVAQNASNHLQKANDLLKKENTKQASAITLQSIFIKHALKKIQNQKYNPNTIQQKGSRTWPQLLCIKDYIKIN